MRKKSTIQKVLEPILKAGSETDIATARKKYWQEYKANWRKNRRRERKEFTVSFSQKELEIITTEAKKHNRSRTRFIKEASLAYCHKEYLIPDPVTYSHIRELLALNYNELQRLSDDKKIDEEQGSLLLKGMEELEVTILKFLQSPISMEEWLTEIIYRKPEIKEKFSKLLATLSV